MRRGPIPVAVVLAMVACHAPRGAHRGEPPSARPERGRDAAGSKGLSSSPGIELITRPWTEPVAPMPALPPPPTPPPDRAAGPAIVIAPNPPFATWRSTARSPADEAAAVRKLLPHARGADRLELRFRLVAALEELAWDEEDPDRIDGRLAAALAESRRLVAEPDLARHARADEALYRHAGLEDAAGDRAAAAVALVDLLARYPASRLVPWVHVRQGDRAVDDGDPAAADRFYQQALRYPTSPLDGYVRYRRAWVRIAQGDHTEALEELMRVAGGADPTLAAQAADDMVTPYAVVGRADRALPFLARVAPARARDLAARLAARYAAIGKLDDAATLYAQLAADEPDAAAACGLRHGALAARLVLGGHADILAAAADLLATAPTGDCATTADALLASLALSWHRELSATRVDPRDVIRAWELALGAATRPARATAAARNLAEVRWYAAARRGDPIAWTDAGDAFRDAAGRAGDADLDAIAVDAYDNAVRMVRGGASLSAATSARLRRGLASVDARLRARATVLAAALP